MDDQLVVDWNDAVAGPMAPESIASSLYSSHAKSRPVVLSSVQIGLVTLIKLSAA